MNFYLKSRLALHEADEERLRYLAARGDASAQAQLDRLARRTTAIDPWRVYPRPEPELRWAAVHFEMQYDYGEEEGEGPPLSPATAIRDLAGLGIRAITNSLGSSPSVNIHSVDDVRTLVDTVYANVGGGEDVVYLPSGHIARDWKLVLFSWGSPASIFALDDNGPYAGIDEFLENPEPYLTPHDWDWCLRQVSVLLSQFQDIPDWRDFHTLLYQRLMPSSGSPDRSIDLEQRLRAVDPSPTSKWQALAEIVRRNRVFNLQWYQPALATRKGAWW